MRVTYVVPRAGGHGGIQQFAHGVEPLLGDDVRVRVESWAAPGRLARARAVAEEVGRRRVPVAPPGAGAADLVHHWHVRAALGRTDRRTVVTCHGTEVMPAGLPRWERAAVRSVLARADAVVANSTWTRDLLLREHALDPGRVRLVHPGVAPSPHGRVRPASSRPVVGTLTRLVPRKNVGVVVEAVRHLVHDRGVDLVYRLAGDGPQREDILRGLEAADVDHEYLGPVTEERKTAEFYPGLDVFVLPALETATDVEGFGIVYLEANAAGTPVVAAPTGGVVDAVQDGQSGLFSDPHDPHDVARAVLEVLEDREAYSRGSLAWAEANSVKASAAGFRALYDEIVVGSSSSVDGGA